MTSDTAALACVESPLQVVAAAEWAESHPRKIVAASHGFEWVRRTARPINLPGSRVLLVSALSTDGRMSVDRYLRWMRSEAAQSPVIYLPNRRELVLAGAQEPLEVITLPTSTRTTLVQILAGTGTTIRTRSLRREAIR